jgi:prevent-host-death family protein
MKTVNIHQAKTQLSKLVDDASKGKPFIIAKAGKPMVKVIAIDSPNLKKRSRLGFMAGEFEVPDDFDTIGSDEIQRLFSGEE